jgi:predicted lipase
MSSAGLSKTVGYVALDDANQMIIISIQGTSVNSNPTDFITDVDFIKLNTTLCGSANTHDGCQLHDGFYQAMQDAATVVTPVVLSAAESYPEYTIVATGHSLGAAVAALLGTQLRNQGTNVDIYTYGQPHIGDEDVQLHSRSVSGEGRQLSDNPH